MNTLLASTKGTQAPDEREPDQTNAENDQNASEPVEPLSLDLVFEVLKNERRRHVLRYLDDNPGSTSLSDLAEHIAALENDKSISALSSQERKRVYVGLYQCHLPKMDDTDVIEFDDDRGTVELGENAAQLYSFLETEETETRPWPRYYLAHTAISAALFSVAAFALPTFMTVVFGVSLLGFAALGALQTSEA